MFRISRDARELIINVDAIEQIEPEIRALPTGRWHIDEVPPSPIPSGHSSRRWGVGEAGAEYEQVLRLPLYHGQGRAFLATARGHRR
jgi:hypothetical protein